MDIPFILRFHVDDPATGTRRRFSKDVTFKAPHVPRIGERAVIPGVGRTNLGGHKIVDIIYTPSGTVILDFELEGLLVSADQQKTVLEKAGFTEVADAEAAGD